MQAAAAAEVEGQSKNVNHVILTTIRPRAKFLE